MGGQVNLILGYVVAGAILFVMFATGVGMTPVPWILIGEWFPPANKAFIGSFCTALFNISNFLSIQVLKNQNWYLFPSTAKPYAPLFSQSTNFLQSHLALSGVFGCYGLCVFLSLCLGIFWVPETSGETFYPHHSQKKTTATVIFDEKRKLVDSRFEQPGKIDLSGKGGRDGGSGKSLA